MPNRFKPGDLITLNEYGLFVTEDYEEKVGIIVSEAYSILSPYGKEEDWDSFFTVHDILLGGELVKMVPESFMDEYNIEK